MKAEEIKKYLNKPVKYKGTEYRLTGAIFRKDKDYYYQAELTDKCNRSICICKLEDVEVENDNT